MASQSKVMFEFNRKVLTRVADEIRRAEEYVRIAVFQLHNQDIFDALYEKLNHKVKVEIITLPLDSVNEDKKEAVTQRFQKFEQLGGKVYQCKWNIGDPERTTTAVGRWYSFHGKFMVTDKSAMALSANLTEAEELDAVILFDGDEKRIEEFNEQFQHIVYLFIQGDGKALREIIKKTKPEGLEKLFQTPRVIETDTHNEYWITDYPAILCPPVVKLENRLLIAPFDYKARDLFEFVINEAKEFVLISTESFTDPAFSEFLIQTALRGIKVHVLAGATSMDFKDRLDALMKNMLANGVVIKTTEEPLHAKLLVTDRRLVVSSVNLNKMNLGFARTQQLWRSNTETLCVAGDVNLIREASQQFAVVFDHSVDVVETLSKKTEASITKLLFRTFGVRSGKDVKSLFAKLLISEEIANKKTAFRIGRIIAQLLRMKGKSKVDKETFLKAVLLYYLSERKHDFSDLLEKLRSLDPSANVRELLSWLETKGFVEQDNGYYKIKVEMLFSQHSNDM